MKRAFYVHATFFKPEDLKKLKLVSWPQIFKSLFLPIMHTYGNHMPAVHLFMLN